MELLHTLHVVLRTFSNITSQKNVRSAANFVICDRSPDLNPCDFWLWCHLKQLVSCDQRRTLPDLNDSFSRHVLNIYQNTLWSTVEHAILRFQIVAENDGHHVEHLFL
ncbi:uncharacterized protein TNCV_4191451 [Trichonephila clavipes]|nr:uncharacterized protein TNCV_4191451 [Trichonephila clavipes]